MCICFVSVCDVLLAFSVFLFHVVSVFSRLWLCCVVSWLFYVVAVCVGYFVFVFAFVLLCLCCAVILVVCVLMYVLGNTSGIVLFVFVF